MEQPSSSHPAADDRTVPTAAPRSEPCALDRPAPPLALSLSDEVYSLPGRTGIYRQLLDGDDMPNIIGFVCVGHPANHDLQSNGHYFARRIVQCVNGWDDLVTAATEALEELYRVSPSRAAPTLRAALAKSGISQQ